MKTFLGLLDNRFAAKGSSGSSDSCGWKTLISEHGVCAYILLNDTEIAFIAMGNSGTVALPYYITGNTVCIQNPGGNSFYTGGGTLSWDDGIPIGDGFFCAGVGTYSTTKPSTDSSEDSEGES